ncbi:hypothetical protein SADUNF_Sadunf13G0118400 [Salix dunnii]|uniref:Uncharacterized protein n=1 Tax=Salix dunnii TaxID=1413687 RepID=A0A835MLE5_9ROSI|nr:hypothetical protein SADUNF_Sadunf13G0118400 [Salix dunnii]
MWDLKQQLSNASRHVDVTIFLHDWTIVLMISLFKNEEVVFNLQGMGYVNMKNIVIVTIRVTRVYEI